METRDILSGAKSFHKIYNQVIQTAAAQHHLSLMDADIILFLYNNPDYDTAKDISYFRMLAKSGVSASVESLTSLGNLESHEDTADRRKILRTAEPRDFRGRTADVLGSFKTDDG